MQKQDQDFVLDQILYEVTQEHLIELFNQSFVPWRLTDRGRLKITEPIGCYVVPSSDGREIQLYINCEGSDSLSMEEKVAIANRFNDERKLVRLSVDEDGDLSFNYLVVVDGGVTRANIIRSIRYFLAHSHLMFGTPEVQAMLF